MRRPQSAREGGFRRPNYRNLRTESFIKRTGNVTDAVRKESLLGDVENQEAIRVCPSQCTFGRIKQGCTYTVSLQLQNVGLDLCRFRVQRPTDDLHGNILRWKFGTNRVVKA